MPAPDNELLELFQTILDIPSVSRDEKALADWVMGYLSCHPLELIREGNTIVARTDFGRPERVVIAGHLDTVPIANNLPSWTTEEDGQLMVHGRGTADMKGGIAAMLYLAANLEQPNRDITWVFYECEEIEASANGLGRLVRSHPELLSDAAIAILMEPTAAQVEGGCQGTMRFEITTHGKASHSARAWLGENAIHEMGRVLARVQEFELRQIKVAGLTYREGLNATLISGGVAGNVIPDSCTAQINYRFAPDKTASQAQDLMHQWFADWEVETVDLSPAAAPGLDRPAAKEFVAAIGSQVLPKYGWTDVARFTELGVPALNYGPADAGKAHADDECCPLWQVSACVEGLQRWLTRG